MPQRESLLQSVLDTDLLYKQQAPFLRMFLWGLLGVDGLLILLFSLSIGRAATWILLGQLLVIPIIILVRRLVDLGRIPAALYTMAGGLLLLCDLVAVPIGVESSFPFLVVLLLPVIMIGVLVGRRPLIVCCLATLGAAVTPFIVSKIAPGLTGFAPLRPVRPAAILGTFGCVTILIALFLDHVGSTLRAAVAAAGGANRRMEAELQERRAVEARLLQHEERMQELFRFSEDVITIIDARGVVLYQSPAFMRVFGYDADTRIGLSMLTLVHPDDVGDVERSFEQVLREPGQAVRSECRMRHRDGSWRAIEVTGVNQLNNPAVRGLVMSTRDITSRKQLEAQFLQAQKMESLGRLAGGVAHDFNNLLTIITGTAQLAMAGVPPTHPVTEDLQAITDASERAARLTQQLLLFSRQQAISRRVFNLNDLITDLQHLGRRLVGAKVTLALALARDLPAVRADPGQIEQALVNLLVNAGDAMPDGGLVALTTRVVDRSSEQKRVQVEVSDTGTGMSEDIQARIFEPFFTTKPVGQGTGLGLATTYGIVSQHSGTISVKSTFGQGTSFIIELPAAVDSAERPRHTGGASELPRGTETILVVEDEPLVQELVVRTLRSLGYTTLSADTGGEALRLIDVDGACRVDLLLTDVIMPEVSGPELVEQLRTRHHSPRVLFMSGYTNNAFAPETLDRWGAQVLPKPFTIEGLARTVRDALDRPVPDNVEADYE